jgi:uncharacterized membrane protein YgcG
MNKIKAALIALVSTAFLIGCGNNAENGGGGGGNEVSCLLTSGQCSKMEPATCLDLGGQGVEQCPADEGNNVICLLTSGQCSKMKPATCLNLGGQSVEQCPTTGGDGNSSNSSGDGNSSNSSGGGNNIGGDGDLCTIGGNRALCQWDTGCYFSDSGFEKKPCTQVIANCLENGGKLFTVVNLNVPNKDMHVDDNGFQCANIGGTEFEGSLPGISSPSGGKSSSSSGGGGEDIDFCTLDNGKRVFCQWPEGCFEQSSTFDPQKRTCSAIISDCFAYGQVFSGVDSSKLTEANGFGEELKCADIGGTKVTTTGVTGDEGGHCKLNGKVFFCQYGQWLDDLGGCFASSYEYSPENGNCQAQYNNCILSNGTIYFNVDNDLLTEANGYGSGLQCSTLGGTLN